MMGERGMKSEALRAWEDYWITYRKQNIDQAEMESVHCFDFHKFFMKIMHILTKYEAVS